MDRRKREIGINPKKWVESVLPWEGTGLLVQFNSFQPSSLRDCFFRKPLWIDIAGSEQISRFKSARETWKPPSKPGVIRCIFWGCNCHLSVTSQSTWGPWHPKHLWDYTLENRLVKGRVSAEGGRVTWAAPVPAALSETTFSSWYRAVHDLCLFSHFYVTVFTFISTYNQFQVSSSNFQH